MLKKQISMVKSNMKILLPTDFSKLSKVAIHYAAKMALKLNAEIVLFHAVFIDAPPKAQTALKAQQILDAMAKNAKEDFVYIENEIKKECGGKVKISSHIIKGYPVEDVIETFAEHNNIDLIIMGTKGASGLKKVLMGSNTSAVISNSNIPVIAIPEHARFRSIKHIVYASDMQMVKKEIQALMQFARLFNATIHILHIIPPDSKKKIDKTKIKKEIIAQYKYSHISVHVSLNDDIIEGIDEYIADVKADMLAMFTHKPTFFEKLFGKSITRQMAFHAWTPLLTIKKQSTKGK